MAGLRVNQFLVDYPCEYGSNAGGAVEIPPVWKPAAPGNPAPELL